MNPQYMGEHMKRRILYHGSAEIITAPTYGKGKKYKDYGQGFYCTEYLDLAREWACADGKDGYVNRYEFDETGLCILNLSDPEYTILHWLALVMEHRRFQIFTPMMKQGVDWLHTHFLINIDFYDVIVGNRADDSYFSFARAFVNNEISLSQLFQGMQMNTQGEQVVLRRQNAFEAIQFLSFEIVDSAEYAVRRRTRDDEACLAIRKNPDGEDGLFMRDIIREEVLPNDPRLRF